MMNEIYWYELCFFGDEDEQSDAYNPDKACSYVIKTEIPPIINDKVALEILFKDMDEDWIKELKNNCTCVMEVSKYDAEWFDIEDLTVRVEDELGIYYRRVA